MCQLTAQSWPRILMLSSELRLGSPSPLTRLCANLAKSSGAEVDRSASSLSARGSLRHLAVAANLELLVQFSVGILICSLLLFKLIPGLRLGGRMRCETPNLFVLDGSNSRRCTVVTDIILRPRRTKAIPSIGGTHHRRVAADS